MKRLEVLKQQLVMYYIKKSILDEVNKAYYKNSNNIDRVEDIGSECINISATDVAYHIKNIVYFKNGYCQCNDYIEAAAAFPDEFKNKEIIDNILKKGR